MVGRTVGPYRILAQIGAGGMGVVYRAEDTRLGRQVAVKFVAPNLLPDDAALKRFDREARAASVLNHPNICTVHEIGQDGAQPYLVMELLEGTTLRDRLVSGPLPLAELIDLAIPIADALDTAHHQGIIHRDLKPANIFVTERGIPKLLDFGLAKITTTAGHDASTRAAAPHTAPHGVIGTLAYMSPEQVRGRPLDARSDIFSFGAVLYEMATGVSAFDADTTGLIFENVLTRTPIDVSTTSGCPPAFEAIVSKALEKDPALRYQSARELLVDLKRLKGSTANRSVRLDSGSTPVVPLRPRVWRVLAGAAGAILLIAAAVWWYTAHTAVTGPVRLELGAIQKVTSLPGLETQPTLSPDGKLVAFVWQKDNNRDIWIKQISGGDPLQLTDDPADDFDPDWSPDGSTIVFRSERRGGGLFTIPALRGDVTKILDQGFRPRWSPDGRRILFQKNGANLIPNEIKAIDYPGGQVQTLLPYEPGKDPFLFAEWAPDGRAVVSYSGAMAAPPGLLVRPLDGRAAGGFLEWAGARIPRGIAVWAASGRALILEGSTLGYVPLDANGHAAGPLARLTTSPDALGDVSADGRVLAYVSGRTTQTDIWKVPMNPDTGVPVGKPERIVNSSAVDQSPLPLPDNRHLLFLSNRDGGPYLYVCNLDGSGVKPVDKSRVWRRVASVSPDGRTIALWRGDPGQPVASFLLAFDPATLEATGPARQIGGTDIVNNFSPDGRYLLFAPVNDERLVLHVWDRATSDQPVAREWPLSEAFTARHVSLSLPHFTADGRWILFDAFDAQQRASIYVVRTGGGDPVRVGAGELPQWTYDTRRLYMWQRRSMGSIDGVLASVTFDPERGEARPDQRGVPFEPGRGSTRTGFGNLTPDRRWFYFEWIEEEGDVFIAALIVRQ